MRESVEWLGSHFLRLRIDSSSSADATGGYAGLYPTWSPYAPSVGRLLVHLTTSIIDNAAAAARVAASSPRQLDDAEHGLCICVDVSLQLSLPSVL